MILGLKKLVRPDVRFVPNICLFSAIFSIKTSIYFIKFGKLTKKQRPISFIRNFSAKFHLIGFWGIDKVKLSSKK